MDLVEEQMAQHLQPVLVILEVFHLPKVFLEEIQLEDVHPAEAEAEEDLEQGIMDLLEILHPLDQVEMEQEYQLDFLDQLHLHMELRVLMEVKDIFQGAAAEGLMVRVRLDQEDMGAEEQLIHLALSIQVVAEALEDLQDTLHLLFLQAVDLV